MSVRPIIVCPIRAAGAALLVALAACESSTEIESKLRFSGALAGVREKPTATTSSATGEALVEVSSNGTLAYNVTWTGLSGSATGAHIHGPADTSNTAGVLIDFAAPPLGTSNQTFITSASGSASGIVNVKPNAVITFTVSGDSLVKLLNAGLLYVNVHTAANPDGEIRAQLRKP